MEGVKGQLFRFCEQDKNLLAFVSTKSGHDHAVCSNAVILIPGLTDGFMALNYTCDLSLQLEQIDFSLVQVNLSSSFNQFGFSSLQQDCKEIGLLIAALKSRYHFKSIVLLGHSTGTQDTLFFLRYGDPELTGCIQAVILQAAISDRDILNECTQTPEMLKEAHKLIQQGNEDSILSQRLPDDNVPVTASRFASLAGRLTPDDMFSTDLTKEELAPILAPVKVPILLYFSENDEFVPDHEKQKAVAERMVSVLKEQGSAVQCVYNCGDHGLTKEEYYRPFIECVHEFIKDL